MQIHQSPNLKSVNLPIETSEALNSQHPHPGTPAEEKKTQQKFCENLNLDEDCFHLHPVQVFPWM